MSHTVLFMAEVSQIFIYLLPVFFFITLVFIVLVLKELVNFFKKLETTSHKVDNLNMKIADMQSSVYTSLEEPELLNLNSYKDLNFNSAMMSNVFAFGLDNSEEIMDWTKKISRGYKWFKKKRKK